MWFRNLRLYRLPSDWDMDSAGLDKLLAGQQLSRCGSLDMFSRGWVYPRQEGQFVHAVNRQWLLALGVEQKLLPTTVVRQEAAERAARIEAEQDRKVGRKEMRDLRDSVTVELLPRAFTRRRTTWCWIDPVNGWLVIDAGSDARADEFLEVLQKTIAGMALRPLQTQLSPASAMTGWLAAGDSPAGFSIDQDLELRSTSAGQAAIRYVRHALEGEEIQRHIASGKIATRLGLTWNDRISFVLTEKLQLKRLAFLDILKEEAEQNADTADEQFDIDFALMSGELARLLADLVLALGGEIEP
ncbi:MAG: recombination-associated protein RdgC [Rhodocyclales bacterium GWA2_65_20]|nr:MAG: recombination-associated protein RdgC [Rhodocyclales bacterium GWA2_65_20]